MSRFFSPAPAGAMALLAASALSACGATGKGVGPVSIQIAQTAAGSTSVAQPVRVFECIPVALTAFIFFSDGSVGNFTNRVTWTSSDDGVVRMSNGEIPDPRTPGALFPAGTAIGTGVGGTTISANFGGDKYTQLGGLTQSVGASTQIPTSIGWRRVDQAGPVPITSLTMGAGTETQMSVVAQLGPVEADVTTAAKLLFLANPANATVVNGIFVAGVGSGGGPQTLSAAFPNCPITPLLPVTVVPVQGISIQPEFGTQTLVTGTTEEMRVFADLGNGLQQDVSQQATFISDDPTTVNFTGGGPLILGANGPPVDLATGLISGGPVNIKAFLRLVGNEEGFQFASPELPITVVSGNLVSFVIQPATATIHQGSDDVLRFHAIGTFDNGVVQDITRSASWGVANLNGNPTPVATIGNQTATKGFATPSQPATSGQLNSGQVEVFAAIGITPPNPARADLFVLSPGQ